MSFSQFVVLMSTTNGQKDIPLGQFLPVQKLCNILGGLVFFTHPLGHRELKTLVNQSVRTPVSQVSGNDTPPGRLGHPTPWKMRIKGDTWIRPITHRLPPLGITSPFDLPEDSTTYCTNCYLFWLGEYTFFQSTCFFISIFRNPWVIPQGNQDNRKLRSVCEQ